MNDSKVIAEQFLGPTTDDMNLAIVVENFFHGAAVANPIKHSSPKVLLVLRDTPAAAGSFADEGVKVAFLLGAFA
jgi:hypothetical protein